MAPEGQLEMRVDRDSGVPLGTQLSWRLRKLIEEGRLRTGERLPSIRDLALQAGVNVNTVRAVYARLEREGVVRSEHGRGTFVTSPATRPANERGRLRREIAALEAELARRPPVRVESPAPRPRSGGALLTTEELASVRDDLMDRLRALDAARAEVIQSLQALAAEERVELAELAAEEQKESEHRSTPGEERSRGLTGRQPASTAATSSLSGARVRWVGA